MPQPILHHYPPSLFSEKIRALFGYLGVDWVSVTIPPIMPRPHLMPLSGGYRKTPIMQIGANIYCDTSIICRKLAQVASNKSLYGHGFAAERLARWADTELFRTTVALNFRPEALTAQMSQMSAEDIAAFQQDRAELSAGAPIVSVNPATAEAEFCTLLQSLERSFDQPYLFGDTPSIADFSLYHCLWFVAGNQANARLLDPWPNVGAYLQRMQAFGHGNNSEMDAEAALQIGTESDPVRPEDAGVDDRLASGLSEGDMVTVTPSDYGRIPVSGKLLAFRKDEVVIEREDENAGRIIVHFPTIGFDVAAE